MADSDAAKESRRRANIGLLYRELNGLTRKILNRQNPVPKPEEAARIASLKRQIKNLEAGRKWDA